MYGPGDDPAQDFSCTLPHDAETQATRAPCHDLAHFFLGDIHVLHFDFGNLVDMLDADGTCDLGTRLTRASANVCSALQ